MEKHRKMGVTTPLVSRDSPPASRHRYAKPDHIDSISLRALVRRIGRGALHEDQYVLLSGRKDDPDVHIYFAGDIGVLEFPAVSIVGTREVSLEGAARAHRLARELARAGVTVVSGLARGVDAEAHQGAIEAGGKTAAVIGTPLDKAYPIENAALQEQIHSQYLLLSPFPVGERVFQSNFPKRNRVMAAVTDATVIVEASDTSGTLHQAVECQRLGRWLFILKSVANNPALKWPRKFLGKPRVSVLTETSQILDAIKRA